MVDGNRLTLISDAPELLDALLALIDGAKSSLSAALLHFLADAAGDRVKSALMAAREREAWRSRS